MNYSMKKLILLAMFSMCLLSSCDNEDFNVATPVYFEKDRVQLDSCSQELTLKCNVGGWQMKIYDENDSIVFSGDTITNDWYSLIKEEKGKQLRIKVEENREEDRSLNIHIQKENYFTQILISQKGIMLNQ